MVMQMLQGLLTRHRGRDDLGGGGGIGGGVYCVIQKSSGPS